MRLSLLFLGLLTISAVFADLIVPRDPMAVNLGARLLPPFWEGGGSLEHILGTDQVGRDILSRMILGSRASLIVAVASIVLGGAVGTILGLGAGYLGGIVDSAIMRMTDAMLSFPMILLALFLTVILGPRLSTLILVIGLVLWARFARLVRGETLSIKTRGFVELAKVGGCPPLTIIRSHIFPHVLNSVMVMSSLMLGIVILMEASLSFLGAGVPPPTPTWGGMVADGREYLTTATWISFYPGMLILLTVLSVNLLGDWMRDRFDPQMRPL